MFLSTTTVAIRMLVSCSPKSSSTVIITINRIHFRLQIKSFILAYHTSYAVRRALYPSFQKTAHKHVLLPKQDYVRQASRQVVKTAWSKTYRQIIIVVGL